MAPLLRLQPSCSTRIVESNTCTPPYPSMPNFLSLSVESRFLPGGAAVCPATTSRQLRDARFNRHLACNASASTSSSPHTSANPLPSPPANAPLAPSKRFDVVTLSNLCVDIMVPMDNLPPTDSESRKALLAELTAKPPPVSQWEVGGNTNTLIAAARLGLRVAAIGHVGQDVYGKFLADVLRKEGVKLIEPVAPSDAISAISPDLATTLLCFVLVAPGAQHAFCSRYDFGPWPLLSFVDQLNSGVENVLDSAAALFVNGFVFDEVSYEVVVAAAQRASRSGAAVFFDPGPRAWTFREGPRKAALDAILDAADVVLMTEEEAEAVSGCSSAEEAARWVLARPNARTEWCVVKRGAEGALLVAKSNSQNNGNGTSNGGGKGGGDDGVIYEQQALKVDVRDTVGCGDSFAAAVILGYTQQHSIPATMALASAVGAATAMGTGAGRNVAKASDVIALLHGAVPDCSDGRHANALKLLEQRLNIMDSDFEE